MKNLNNKGWGLGMMLLLMSILIIFFLVAIYFIYKFYDSALNRDLLSIQIVEKI